MKIILYGVIALVIVSGLFWAFKPDSETAPLPGVFTLVVKNKARVSGPETLTVKQGDTVTIRITSDVPEELHLHGYDKSVDLEKDVQAELVFVADITGRFPYELEKSKTEIGALEVLPK